MIASSAFRPAWTRASLLAAVAVSAAIVAVAALGILSSIPTSNVDDGSTVQGAYVVTPDGSTYFAGGYYSRALNFSQIANGDSLTVGSTSFRYDRPSNLETRTTTTGGATTTIVVTAEYQCGISLGARIFFYARLDNGTEFKLDYCLVLNTAIAHGAYQSSTAQRWSLWEVSENTTPVVAIHMQGKGEQVSAVELWVGR